MSINRYYFQDPLIEGPLNFLAGFGTRRQEVHAQEAGLQEQRAARQQQAGSQGFQAGFESVNQNRRDQRLQGFRLADIAAQGANQLALQRASREVPPGYAEDVAAIYGFGPGAMPGGGGGGSMGLSPPMQAPQISSQQPGPNDAGFFSPGDPGAAPQSSGFVAQPADTKASRDAWANLDTTRASVQRALQRPMPDYERAAVMRAGREAIGVAEQHANQYPKPPDMTPTIPGPDGNPIQMRPGMNPFQVAMPNGGVFIDPQGKSHVIAPTKKEEDANAPYGAKATPEMLKEYARSRVIDNPDGSKTAIQPDGKLTFEHPSKDSGDSFDVKTFAEVNKALTTKDALGVEKHPDVQTTYAEYKKIKNAENVDKMQQKAFESAVSDVRSMKDRVDAGTVTRQEAKAFVDSNIAMFGGNFTPEVRSNLNAILAGVGVGDPSSSSMSPLTFVLPSASAPPSEKMRYARQKAKQWETLAVDQAAKEREIAAQKLEVEQADKPKQMYEIVAAQNAKVKGDGTVGIINANGNVVNVMKSSLTPERIAELKKYGFLLPGFED
mgnify:CR=1 FL=1